MNRGWAEEIWRVALFVIFAVLLGTVFGNFQLWILFIVFAYLAWHLYRLAQLADWINKRLSGEPPQSTGIWEEIFIQLHRFRQRNKRRHKRLVSRLSRFQEAAQALPNAIVVINEQGAIEWCNNAATRMLGIHTKNDLGQRILNLARNPLLVNYIARAEFDEPLLLPSPVNESRTLSIRVVPYGKDQQLLVARDVTQLQHLEQMRRDFVANVSHEMRTPLTVISGYLEMFADGNKWDSQEFSDTVTRMNEQAGRLQNIIGDLLLLSRLESDDQAVAKETVNVNPMLQVLVDEARALSGDKQHVISLESDADLCIRGNESELRSAFSNLVFNAVRYTPEKGEINIHWYQDEQGIHFTVRDTGIGIPAQHIPRLTERFYRIDVARSRHTGGTGLGLAIVKHVLQRHDAQFHIESIAGRGSLFRCDFAIDKVSPCPESSS